MAVKRRRDKRKMNHKQKVALVTLRTKLLCRIPGYEIKTWDEENLGRSISVYVELGPVDSEDTMAEVFCHHHFLATIGPRGGLEIREI